MAKVVGTSLCVRGVILLSFYHEKVIGIGESGIHWGYAMRIQSGTANGSSSSSLLGPVLLILSALIWSSWFIIQADMSKNFPVPYTSTTYMCLLASFQCVFIAVCFDHKASSWSLHEAMRATSYVYSGVICTGLTYCMISWTIERKGPLYLYVSVFTPLQLILTAIISWAFLSEKLYLGTALGSLLIVVELYGVLWGKSQEYDTNKEDVDRDEGVRKTDMEMQGYAMTSSNMNGIVNCGHVM